jgi:hypothetical protein
MAGAKQHGSTCTLITIKSRRICCMQGIHSRALKPWAHTTADECARIMAPWRASEEVRDMDDLKTEDAKIAQLPGAGE